MKKQSGFALVELLLVLAIIAILTAIATPTLLNQRARARDKAALANANALFADLVAGYDRCLEAGTDVSTYTSFQSNVLGSAANPLVPIFFNTRNPWGTPASGYAGVLNETSAQGTTTQAAAVPTAMGQVQVGFCARNGAQPPVVAIAVYLSQPTATLATAAPAAAPPPSTTGTTTTTTGTQPASGGATTGTGTTLTPTNVFVRTITLG
jgi:prepilin-type N-terminal cleavage/methylation domain-containing protein